MQKKTAGVVAGVAGAALLMGGTTFALWSDSADVDGATITAGNLDVAVVPDETSGSSWSWSDISADRTDSPHTIANLADFRIIPGDTIQGTIALDVALEGENMVANLGFTPGAVTDASLNNLDIDLDVYSDSDLSAPVALGPGDTIQLASADNGAPGSLSTVPATLDDTGDLYVVVTVTFPASTADQDLVQTAVSLADSTITLDQVRTDAEGYNS